MKFFLKYLILVCSCVFSLIVSDLSFTATIKISDLINNDKDFDGKEVIIEGEAIGHLMKRGQFAWVNINDETNSIGIWLDYKLANKIKYLGKHAVIGDWVKIDGVFNSHCSIHGGDTDVHAESITVLKRGSPRHLSHDPKKVNVLVVLVGILLCLYIIKMLKRRR